MPLWRFVASGQHGINYFNTMKILKIMAVILCSVASAMGQVVLQQPTGTYTNNSVIIRDGTGNKVKNVPNLLFDPTGALLTVGNNTDEGYYKAIGLDSTASGYLFELKNGGGAVTYQANFFLTNDTPYGLYLNVGASPETVFQANTTTGAVDFPNAASFQETVTITPTTSLLLGTAGSAVGNIGFRNTTSGTATLAPPAGALGTYSVVLPNAASTLPIFGQQITFTGPTAARSIAIPDANFTAARTDAANTFTGVQSMTSPAITTSVTTPSTTFSLYNTTATTINAFGGASVALNMGNASGATAMLGIIGFNGATPSSTTSAIFPASTTGVSSLRIPHGSAPTSPVNGDFWTTSAGGLFGRINGATINYGSANISGLTTAAIVTASSATAIQTPSPTAGTLDSSGNAVFNTVTIGSGASTAGAVVLGQGTTQSTGTTNITIQAPAAVTSYIRTLPSAVGSTGYVKETVSGSVQTESVVTSIPATDISSGALNIGNNAATVGTVELANGTANTLSASGGVLSIESVVIPSISSTNVLTSKQYQLTAAHGTDDTWEGTSIAGLNAGATIAQWEIVYLGGSSTWLLADANGSGTYPSCGMAVAAYSNTNPAIVITRGTVRNDAWAWTPGGRLYMSATPGGLTQTPPATSGDKVQDVGFALTADIAYVDFNGVYLTVQ